MKSCQIPCDLPLGVQENHQNHAGYRSDGCWRECCQQVDHATVCSNAGSITYIQHTHTHTHRHRDTHTHTQTHPSMHALLRGSIQWHPPRWFSPTHTHLQTHTCIPVPTNCSQMQRRAFELIHSINLVRDKGCKREMGSQ